MGVELLKHNQETYEKMTEMFKIDNRVAVVQPTGTGKSFLMLKWIEDHINEDIIVLSPSNILFDQLYRYAKDSNFTEINKVPMLTYAKVNMASLEEVNALNAHKIILDEFHRTGAEKWGESVDYLLESHPNAKILGLTATPIRYLDKSRNMGTEIFNDNYATYMELFEAIVDGILPVPKYVPVWYDYDDELTAYQLDIENLRSKKARAEAKRKLKEFKNNLQNSYGAEVVFKDNMPNDHGKYIVFCKDRKHIKLMQKMMKYWLRDINTNIHCYKTLSSMPDKDEIVKDFINDNDDTSIKLLFAVNRLNEGLHVPGIDGVVMLRPVTSPIMYFQQIGRAFAIDNDTPLIFDMVRNYKNLNVVDPDSEYINIFEWHIYTIAMSRKIHKSDRVFGIFEEVKKFEEVMDDVYSILYSDYKWDDKFELLKEFKEKYGRFPKKREDIYKGVNLGSWANEQRRFFSNNTLLKDRYKKLESIQFRFETDEWNDKFELLKEFKGKYGRFPKNREDIYKGVNLGSWVKYQKERAKEGKLSNERIKKLESIGIILDSNIRDIIWEEKFENLKEFITNSKRFPYVNEYYNGENIYEWIGYLRGRSKKGKLSNERRKKLESIGIYFIDGKTIFKKKDEE